MKNHFKKVTLTLLALFAGASCSSGKRAPSLDNRKISRFGSYASVGYGSKGEENAQKKNRKQQNRIGKSERLVLDNRNGDRNHYVSKAPFTLVGESDGMLEDLVVDGSDIAEIRIDGYADLPGFIAFSYGDKKEGENYKLNTAFSDGNGRFLSGHRWNLSEFSHLYLLSKKTGMLYDFQKAQENLGVGNVFFGGEDALYVEPNLQFGNKSDVPFTVTETTDKNHYRIMEADGVLEFTKSFSYRIFDSLSLPSYIDSYGNFLLNNGSVISTSGRILSPDSFTPKVEEFEYDYFIDRIYTKIGHANYYLNDKTELVELGDRIGCVTEETEVPEIDKMLSTMDSMHLITATNNEYFYFNSNNHMVFKLEYTSTFSYTVEKWADISMDDFVRANNKIYFVRDNVVFSYNPIDNSVKNLQVEGYQITGIGMDESGLITISGYDSMLRAFVGYLTSEETISMSPVTTDGYFVYALSPLN